MEALAPRSFDVDHRFALILVASIATHLCLAAWVSSRPMPVSQEPTLDELADRVGRRLDAPAPPLPALKIPTIPDLPKAPITLSKPATPMPKARTAEAVEKSAMIRMLTSKSEGDGALAELLKDNGVTAIAAALDGASSVKVAQVGVEAVKAKGDSVGHAATVGNLGVTGVVAAVAVAAKTDVKVKGGVTDQGVEIVRGDLDPRALEAFIKARKSAVQSCYERALLRNRTLQGRLVMRATLLPNGRATEVEVEENSLGSEEVASCVTTMIKSWKFPIQPKAEVGIALPFILAPAL